MWYVIAEPCHVSVLRIGVCDPGGTEWSYRCYFGPAFVRVSIFLTSREHLTLVVISRGLPRGTGISGFLVCP